MEQKIYSLSSRFENFEKINSQFAKVKVYVLYTGRNRNYTDISKTVVENALYSIKNIPLVGEWKEDNFGGHGGKLEISDEGIDWIETTKPYGVVPSDTELVWEKVREKDGITENEYLTCTAYLWYKRYPELEKVLNDGSNQSMEVIVPKYHMDDEGYAIFDEMEFSALCILGKDSDPKKNVEPCFEGAKVTNYSLDKEKFKQEFTEMLQQLKFSIQNQSSSEVDNINDSVDKGGIQVDKLELVAKYNLTVEQLDFNIEEVTIEELEEKLKEFASKISKPETSFSATYRQRREALQNALDPKIEKDADGKITYEEYLWVNDFDDQYVYVEKTIWTPDYENKYGRYTYTFDEEKLTATITSEFEEMVLVWLTLEENQKLQEERTNTSAEFEKLKGEYEEYKTKYSTPNEEVTRLQEFEKTALETERKESEESLFEQFDEKLKGVEEYEELKKGASTYSIDALEKECFVILGKKNANFSAKSSTKREKVKIDFTKKEQTEDEYGGLLERYSKKE